MCPFFAQAGSVSVECRSQTVEAKQLSFLGIVFLTQNQVRRVSVLPLNRGSGRHPAELRTKCNALVFHAASKAPRILTCGALLLLFAVGNN
jgi:hypothetical protein